MNVTNLAVFRSRDTVAALQNLLLLAENGELIGLAICGVYANGEGRTLLSGRCRDEPEMALRAAMKMSWAVTRLQDELDAAKEPPPIHSV